MLQENDLQDTGVISYGDSFDINFPVADELGTAVVDKNYTAVKSMLSNDMGVDPNLEIYFHGSIYMTALEFSVYGGDWKMTLLLFLNGADPSYNCFDGTIQSNGSQGRYSNHAFMNRTCIPGFEGLKALSGDSKVMGACLWLMEFADGSIIADSNVDGIMVLSNLSILLKDLELHSKVNQEFILKGNGYIDKCYLSLMNRVRDQSNIAALNNELFEIVSFSLRQIVKEFIDL